MAAIAGLLLLPLLATTLAYIIGGSGNYNFYKLIYDILRRPSKLHHTISDRLKSYGGTLHSSHRVLTCDPKNLDHIFNKRHSNFPKGPEFKDKLDALGEGIFAMDGESGLSQRRILHSVFNSPPFEQLLNTSLLEKLESGMFPVLDRAVGARSGEELDMQDVYKRFMFDSICMMVLGYDPNYLTVELLLDVHYAKAYEDLEEAAVYRYLMPDFWWKFQRWAGIGEERKYKKALKKFDEFLYERINVKRGSLYKTDEGGNDQFDFLTFFMVEGREQGESGGETGRVEKSNKVMRDMAFNMIAAGRDTVSINLSWLLWLIVSHSNVETKILDEIGVNLGGNRNSWRLLTDEELNNMVYLHATVCEALRLYPPLAFEHRTAIEAERLPSGHFVGKNATILFSMYSMARMENVWGQDCMEFKPERWISEEGDKIVHVPSYKFSAFLAGPRACLGKKIAFWYAKQVTSALIYNYKVELIAGHPVAPAVSITLFMKDGLKVRVSRRR